MSRLKPVSPDRRYGINWGSGRPLEVIDLETGETLLCLYDNRRAVERAAFSRDMRRILCRNYDGSVGVWRMPPRKAGRDGGARDIVEFISYFFLTDFDYYRLRRREPF